MDKFVPNLPRKGRGAVSNASGRYESEQRHRVDDGWGTAWAAEEWETRDVLRTTLTKDATKTIIARNSSPDIGFDRSINPYRGCEHGCVYCFARPTHAYLGLSPGLDFETRLFYKPEAAKLLEAELRHAKYECRHIAMGTNTDPYQPVERRLKITRSILEVLAAHKHPVSIVTKSSLILRDLDILGPMAKEGLAKAAVSVTTLDATLARRMEPRATTPARRIETIRGLAAAGVPTAVMVAPVIPVLTDPEMETILEAAAAAGASAAGHVMLRLPLEIKDLFQEWLAVHAPMKARHVMSLVRDVRGGKEYDSRWFVRGRGEGPYAELIDRRFRLACEKLGLNAERERAKLDCSKFRPPPRPGDQLALF
jgi:DNA repair photolyase